jgi:hypothetical protein
VLVRKAQNEPSPRRRARHLTLAHSA